MIRKSHGATHGERHAKLRVLQRHIVGFRFREGKITGKAMESEMRHGGMGKLRNGKAESGDFVWAATEIHFSIPQTPNPKP